MSDLPKPRSEPLRTSEQADAIYDALAKAQAEFENVERAGKNPHFNAKYAQLGAVVAEVRPKLTKQGIACIQSPTNGEQGEIGVTTRLAHASGQWIESTLYVSPTKFDAQGVGSVITYLRRYALLAMAGVAPDDDDAEAGVGRGAQFITEQQAAELEKLADETGADKRRFCAYMKVAHIREIPAKDYLKAERALRDIGARRKRPSNA